MDVVKRGIHFDYHLAVFLVGAVGRSRVLCPAPNAGSDLPLNDGLHKIGGESRPD